MTTTERRKARVQRSTQSPNRTSVQPQCARRRPGPASRLRAASWPIPLYGGRSVRSPRRPNSGQGARALELSAPLIPLTLRAMNRTPHPHVRSLPRPSVALFSVLALLAFACVPVLAQAETVYETEKTNLPESGGEKSSNHHKNSGGSENSPAANQSGVPGGGGGQNGGGGGHSSPGSSQSPNEPSQQSKSGTSGGAGEAKGKSGSQNGQNPPAVQKGEPKSSVTDSGGSSPLVPILIAVAVLAAISVGAVLVRQRRGSAGGFSLKRG